MSSLRKWTSFLILGLFGVSHAEAVATENSIEISGVAPVTRYVVLDNPLAAAPYITWETGASNIQDAIDVSVDSDVIIVSNGVYDTGGRLAPGPPNTNRVVIDKAIHIKSVNGPEFTSIKGAWDPVTTNGPAAIRCVWMTNGASISGFTITNGATLEIVGFFFNEPAGGGIRVKVPWVATISNCVITGNSAGYGGGVSGGVLYDCVISQNINEGGGLSTFGGGAYASELHRCSIIGNNATAGGGVTGSQLYHCLISNNAGGEGGGIRNSTANHCIIENNDGGLGGGAYGSILNHCLIVGNEGGGGGSGARDSALNGCTVIGNMAYSGTSGVLGGSVSNSILYYNLNPYYFTDDNHSGSDIAYSCTRPLPTGSGNFTNEPQFVDRLNHDFHLAVNSPCRDVGDPSHIPSATDLDGNPRVVNGYMDIGAYEYQGLGQGDYDGDGMGNGDEGIADTDFTDPQDFFEVEVETTVSDSMIEFEGASNRTYSVEYTESLMGSALVWTQLTNGIAGTGGVMRVSLPIEAVTRVFRVVVQYP